MRLILLRHGETTWNAERRLQGHDDAPLSPRGVAQANDLQAFVRAIAPIRVVCSDLGRTRETAALLGFAGAPADRRLREIDMGEWTGRIKTEVEAERPDDYRAWRAGAFTPKNGEGWPAFRSRVVEGLLDSLGENGANTLAVVHGGVIRAACDAFLGLAPARIVPVTPGTATILSFDAADTAAARLEAYNVTSFTPDAPD
jgi:probable phosphoglycerate mutase